MSLPPFDVLIMPNGGDGLMVWAMRDGIKDIIAANPEEVWKKKGTLDIAAFDADYAMGIGARAVKAGLRVGVGDGKSPMGISPLEVVPDRKN
jgi:hypothetical protein